MVKPDARRPVDRSTDRRRALIKGAVGFAATAAVLAGVILGLSAVSRPRSDGGNGTAPTQVTREPEGERLFADAQAALASGDTTKATELLRRVLEIDPDNTQAKEALDQLRVVKEPGGSNGGDTTRTPPPSTDPDFNKAVSDLKKLLPADVPGYAMGTPVADKVLANVPLDPASADTIGRVSRVLLTVVDRGSAKAASQYVKNTTGVAFSKDSQTLKVDGASAYFGTDGVRLAAVAYSRGRYVFEVVVTSRGEPPRRLRDLSVVVATAFPDSLD